MLVVAVVLPHNRHAYIWRMGGNVSDGSLTFGTVAGM